jgi:hypothetical protein
MEEREGGQSERDITLNDWEIGTIQTFASTKFENFPSVSVLRSKKVHLRHRKMAFTAVLLIFQMN